MNWFEESEEKTNGVYNSPGWEKLFKIIWDVAYKENHLYKIVGDIPDPYKFPELRAGLYNAFPKLDDCMKLGSTSRNCQYAVVWLKVERIYGNMRLGGSMYVEKLMNYAEMMKFTYVMNVAGDIIHYKGLFIHRDERDENNRTLPAVVYKNGTKEWWLDGLICRRDMDSEGRWMPVRVDESGRPEWWKLNPRTLPKSEPIWFPQEIFSIDSRYPGE